MRGGAVMPSSPPADAEDRAAALRPRASCIVQAPAGSGKTTLLVNRFAALLTGVETPEQILAITFTRKAAAEMRQRVLALLDDQQDATAAAIRARDQALGWRLAANPSRLQIQTIDSFAMSLTGRLPLASGFDRRTRLVEDGAPLYEAAARQVLNRLFEDDPLSAEIGRFLALNGNDAGKARRLLVEMLGRRDQWLDAVTAVAADREAARTVLERSVRALVGSVIDGVEQAVPSALREELAWMIDFAAAHGNALPTSFWTAASALCMTQAGQFRKRLSQREGFPANADCKDEKQRALDAIDGLRRRALEARFKALSILPATEFSERQIDDLLSVCTVLVLAVQDLSNAMRSERCTDFTELNLAARRALRWDDEAPTELAMALDYRIRHVLIDEFQDTSIAQFDLLGLLVEGWSGEADTSLFAVGDPMQSIYRFRDADVGLFYRAAAEGINSVRLKPLRLTANFRSAPGLVDWFNRTFALIMGHQMDRLAGRVPYGESTAEAPGEGGAEVRLFDDHAEEIEALVARIQALACADPDSSIGLLVRGRNQLPQILEALRCANIDWQATDIDPLAETPAVTDLLSLAGALADPTDALAWLSVLRAPWVGLDLPDLERAATLEAFGLEALRALTAALSPSGARRLQRLTEALGRWLPLRYERPPRSSLEAIWLECGGAAAYGGGYGGGAPAYGGAAAIDQAERFLELVDQLGPEGWDAEQLRRRAERLFAAGNVPAQLQILTIHKAKGLEFDHVLLPCLDRGTRSDDPPLLRWRMADDGILMAAKHSGSLYKWLGAEDRTRDGNELQRLLYVACTRAKRSLLLTAVKGEKAPRGNSLLALLWPALNDEARAVASGAAVGEVPEPRKLLHRLPEDFTWRPPQPTPLVLPRTLAHQAGESPDPIGGRREVILGNLIHEWLRRLGQQPLPQDANAWTAEQRPKWQRQLRGAGLPDAELEVCLNEAARQFRAVLSDAAGRWLLGPKRNAACEYGVTGIAEGVLVSAYFDRTFEEDGVRWIIDYKTGRADGDESSVNALASRYGPQLARYRALAEDLFDEPIRTALYLTAIPRLVEV